MSSQTATTPVSTPVSQAVSQRTSRAISLIYRQNGSEMDKNDIGSLSVPSFINNFFDSLFSRRYADDITHIDEIMKAFWTFRDLVFDMKYESDNKEMYDVLFEKLKLVSDKQFNLPEKKHNELNEFLEIYYCDLVSDLMYGKYKCDDAYDLSETRDDSWIFSTY
jgi:hypothetical protein